MGLMDKLKNVKSSLTGDWAVVTVDASPVARGGTLAAKTEVTVKSQEISIEGIVIEVRCHEYIDIPDAIVWEDSGASTISGTRRAQGEADVVTKEVRVSGPTTLAAGSSSTYSGELQIPTNAPPTMHGRHARYEWEVRARVEMKGNDPDSGWKSLQVD